MARTVEALDGLALLGQGRVGDLAFPVPTVLDPQVESPATDHGFPLLLRMAPALPGQRRWSISQGTAELALEITVPTPEVSGIPGVAVEMGRDAWFAHAPVPPNDLERLRAARPSLVVLGNARQLWAEGEHFVESIRALRMAVGGRSILWAPRVGLPHRLALLAYLGVDWVDATEALWQSGAGRFFDAELGELPPTAARRPELCPCPSCTMDPPGPLADHVLWVLRAELTRVHAAIRLGRLRELVEVRLTAEPTLAEMLRYADRDLDALLEQRLPVVSDDLRGYVLRESQRRPEVRRYRERFRERYRPPPSKELLLLLPCSRTKPYRNSRSHRRFMRALEGLSGLERVHVVSVTSPLGVVPRELEDTYPARHYDIPVTGDWDEAEREAVALGVQHLLSSGVYRNTVVHLDPDEYGFLRDAVGSAAWTVSDHRTGSPESLRSLRAAVESAGAAFSAASVGPLAVVREELESVAAFQFGREGGRALFAPPVRLAGRPWFQRVTDGHGTDLATWKESRGLFQLTVAGGARLLPSHALEVEVASQVHLLGDLFAPGVVRADPQIRIGDAVLLVRDAELLGVGEACLPGPLMTELERGIAVHVRHRIHAPPGAPEPKAT